MSVCRTEPRALLIRPRVYLGNDVAIGPGKIDLLRQVGLTHSIAAAARALHLPYKKAWMLIDTLNRGFGRPVIDTTAGGRGGGGASVTPLGQQLIARYDALQSRLTAETELELQALQALID